MFDLDVAGTGQILCLQVGILLVARRKPKALRTTKEIFTIYFISGDMLDDDGEE